MNTTQSVRSRLKNLFVNPPEGSRCWGGSDELLIRREVFAEHLYGKKELTPADHSELIEEVLHEALEVLPSADSSSYISWLVQLGATFGYTSASARLLIQLVLRLGHHTHEELVAQLDKFQMPLAISTFVFVAKNRKLLLSNEFGDKGDAMARKAVWALGKLERDQNSAEANAGLRELAEFKDRKVARYATSMLKRGEC